MQNKVQGFGETDSLQQNNFLDTFVGIPTTEEEVVVNILQNKYLIWSQEGSPTASLVLWKYIAFYATYIERGYFNEIERERFKCPVNANQLELYEDMSYMYYRYFNDGDEISTIGENCLEHGEAILKRYPSLYAQRPKGNWHRDMLYAHIYYEVFFFNLLKDWQSRFKLFDKLYDKPVDRYYATVSTKKIDLSCERALNSEGVFTQLYDRQENTLIQVSEQECVEMLMNGWFINGLVVSGFSNDKLSFEKCYFGDLC